MVVPATDAGLRDDNDIASSGRVRRSVPLSRNVLLAAEHREYTHTHTHRVCFVTKAWNVDESSAARRSKEPRITEITGW